MLIARAKAEANNKTKSRTKDNDCCRASWGDWRHSSNNHTTKTSKKDAKNGTDSATSIFNPMKDLTSGASPERMPSKIKQTNHATFSA